MRRRVDGLKYCPRCEETKSLEEFPDNGNGTKYGYCKPCKSEYMLQYNRTNGYYLPNLRRACARAGVTVEWYEQKCKEQDGACAICKTKTFANTVTNRLTVDHDHVTGQARGLLCGTCNTGLGGFQDNLELLESAVRYLKESKCRTT